MVGLIAVAVLAVVRSDPFDAAAFDRGRWEVRPRFYNLPMARGAVRRVVPGMAEREVVAFLGEPSSVTASHELVADPPAGAVRTLEYFLGGSLETSRRGLDDAFVWVHVGADGRVIKAVIGGS